MCGISGWIGFNGAADEAAVTRMGQTLSHRGPDGNWQWTHSDGSASFAYRRLAIIDPEHCLFHPFVWQDRYLVLYNGEIYNYKTLRASLETKGYAFNSSSDAEVLPALYHCYGEDCLQKIDGMFSFALWDIHSKELFCARDRFGEKPFFYSIDNERFVFASEIKALQAGGVNTQADSGMLFNYLAYNLVENPNDISQTFFDNVKRLPPATWMKVNASGNITHGMYWQLPLGRERNTQTFEQNTSTFESLLHESVKRRLYADTEVGCCISGGLDSSAVFSLMQNEKPNLRFQTFTARIRDKRLDEGPYVATLLQHLPAQNHEAWVDEGLLIQSLDRVLAQQEEPVSDLTVLAQAALMERAAHEKIKVLLDGQGADEMLAGYDGFYHAHLRDRMQAGFGAQREALRDYYEKHGRRYKLDAVFYFDLVAPRLRRALSNMRRRAVTPPYMRYLHPSFANAYRKDEPPFPRFESLEEALRYRTTRYGLHKLLRYADRNGMANGVEVRFPFLYHKLVEFVFGLPSDYKIHRGWTKYVLRKAMEHRLPPSINWRTDKLGYQVPGKTWLQHPKVIEMVRDAQHTLAQRKLVRADVKLNNREATNVLIASRFV